MDKHKTMNVNYLHKLKMEYCAPWISVAEYAVEQGFATSGPGSAGWDNADEENDLGDF